MSLATLKSSAEKAATELARILKNGGQHVYTEAELREMRHRDLVKLAKQLKLEKTSGTKDEITGRLLAFFGKANGNEVEVPNLTESEDENGEGPTRRKKKWGSLNPLKVPPNEYHEDVFRANFPLVDIVEVPEGVKFPVPDKFEGVVLNNVLKEKAMEKWIKRVVKAENYFGQSVSEAGGHQKHFAMFEDLGDFTRIAPHEVARVNSLLGMVGGKRKWEHLDEGEAEANEGVSLDCVGVEPQGPMGGNSGKSSTRNEADRCQEQVKASLKGELACPEAVTGYADGIMHVWDRRPEKRRKANDGSCIQTQRVACILERKWKDDIYKFNAYFQGGFYAVKHCLVNIQNGHGTPIYIIVMTGDKWSYGQLVPHGYVQLKNGRIDAASMEVFTQHQQLTGHFGRNIETLQQALDKGTAFLRKHYPADPKLEYNDEPQLVGTLYLSSEWLPLPKADAIMGCMQPGVDRLFDGLMRLVIGDSVLGFSSEDFDLILRRRKQFVQEQIAMSRPSNFVL